MATRRITITTTADKSTGRNRLNRDSQEKSTYDNPYIKTVQMTASNQFKLPVRRLRPHKDAALETAMTSGRAAPMPTIAAVPIVAARIVATSPGMVVEVE